MAFSREATEWAIEISGGPAPKIFEPYPARLEVYHSDQDIRQFAAGYKTVKQAGSGVDANTDIADAGVTFHIHDHWSLTDTVLSLDRKVEVSGNGPGGFYSSIVLTVDPATGWTNVSYLAPGVLYGDPTYDGNNSPGSAANYNARRLILREDIMPAPMFGLSFSNGASVTLLDPA
ncbi:MAG TPA: hypothetical protein VHC44_04845, partial [Verrucomicrobiae bacterium]|nr:hypothetical protein [Verrucomicrobiae bacterium]